MQFFIALGILVVGVQRLPAAPVLEPQPLRHPMTRARPTRRPRTSAPQPNQLKAA